MSLAAAFSNASGLDIDQVKFLVAGVAAVAVLLWGGWALLSVWRGWAGTRVTQQTLIYASARIVLLLVLILWIVT